MIKFPITLELDINDNCNFCCSYCRNNAIFSKQNSVNNITTNQIIKLISECKQHNIFKLIISGGEPTIHPDFLTIINHIKLCNIRWTLITNGYTLDLKLAKILKECKVDSVYITLSGMTDETDGYYKGMKNSFSGVKKAIENLLSVGIHVNLGYLLTPRGSKELGLLNDFLFQYNITCKISNVVPIGRAKNWNLDANVGAEFLKKIKENHGDRVTFTDDMLSPEKINCQAGILSCVVYSNGDVIPCASFVNQGISAGNIMNSSLFDIWNNSLLLKNLRNQEREDKCGKCNDCAHVFFCKKGCRAQGYIITKNINSIDGRCLCE